MGRVAVDALDQATSTTTGRRRSVVALVRVRESSSGAVYRSHIGSLGEFDVTMIIEHAAPGTALDSQLRREQAAALLALLARSKRKTKTDGQDAG